MVFLLVLVSGFVLSLLIVLYSLLYGITPMPTSRKVRKELLQTLPELGRGQIYELGSGWGGIAFALARHYPECEVVAYEISPIPYVVSSVRKKLLKLKNIRIVRRDFFKESFSGVTLIYCYLYPGAMVHLSEKVKSEMRGGVLISNTFFLPYHSSKKLSKNLYIYDLC